MARVREQKRKAKRIQNTAIEYRQVKEEN